MVADFRSDTVTRPTAAMLKAMSEAIVGDDVFGEDPTVALLQQDVATLFGKEAALFVTSGTMANQLAIHLQTRPGDAVLAEAEAHVAFFEAGAPSALSGVQVDFIPRDCRLSDAAIAERVAPETMHKATTSLIVVENSHTMGAGRVLSVDEVSRVATKARTLGLRVHCDGARIWNAAVMLGVSEAELAKPFDTLAVCFSKGLGAPVGSALIGPASIMERAKKLRKRWGGAMRQSGYLAAAALHGMRHHRVRIVDDHRRARVLAETLRQLGDKVTVNFPDPGTNMVFFKSTSKTNDEIISAAAVHGILIGHSGNGWVRVVMHLDVNDADLEKARTTLTSILR